MHVTPTLERPPATPAQPPETERTRVGAGLLDPRLLWTSVPAALRKLSPVTLWRNPVMFVVWVGAVFTTVLSVIDPSTFTWLVTGWLWLTVVFGNLAEAVAEGRGRAQAESLRRTRSQTTARRLIATAPDPLDVGEEQVGSQDLRPGDLVVVEAGEVIPGDGEIVDGAASVDESAITGESAPVIRAAGGDRSGVTGGTTLLSDRIVVRITTTPGETFLDRMIALVEGADRQRTPNERALNLLLVALSLVFVVALATLQPFAIFSHDVQGAARDTAILGSDGVAPVVLVGLLVALIPTTIGALLSAIGIAGMDRLVQRNVLAMSGRAVEAAGDVDTLLLDKTGTITLGNRRATEFLPVNGAGPRHLATAALLASHADDTPEGRSIVALARDGHALPLPGLDPDDPEGGDDLAGAVWHPFSARTRMSGVDLPGPSGRQLRKGAADAVVHWVEHHGGSIPDNLAPTVAAVAERGGTPLVVAELRPGNIPRAARVLGVVHLADIVKPGLRERFDELRAMGIRTVMVTGDNPVTAKVIAHQAGVDDVLAEATPEGKLALIAREQRGGRLVAMTGDGTNDAPALAQADVGVAMNTGTAAAKEAGNMVDLDSDPTKLIDIVEVGKQLLITRGALTTFSIANDIAKYFAVLPAMFGALYPSLDALDVMRLHSPMSAILSTVIFNALIIVALIPLALRGVRYRPSSPDALLTRNLWVYGVGGLITPFVGIKLIDVVLAALVPGLV